MALYHRVMAPDDCFILSKGHSAGALYVTLWSLGLLSEAELQTFARDNTLLPGHPSGSGIPGVMFSSGSLGHGPSLAAGLALAARHKGLNRRVYCLCGDGEWQEGSCWEALTFAAHQKLENLILLIDQNGLQGFGRTDEVISCADLVPRISSFGVEVRTVDGHDCDAIVSALSTSPCGLPRVLVLKTIKGNGLHYANRLESHYLPLTEEQYLEARASVEQGVDL